MNIIKGANPFKTGSPEWQLEENRRSNILKASAFRADAERAQRQGQDAENQAEAYASALAKLTGEPA